MIYDLIALSVALVVLIISSITDIKKREAADSLTYGLLFFGLGLRSIQSVLTQDWMIMAFSLGGLLFTWLFSLMMFYTGQWGGGDAKMLMGLGALFGTYANPLGAELHSTVLSQFSQHSPLFLVILLFNIALAGSLYGLVWMVGSATRHWDVFIKTYYDFAKKHQKIRIGAYLGGIIIVLLTFFLFPKELQITGFALTALILVLPVVHNFAKSVEKAAMIKDMPVKDIEEGEWIVNEVKHGKTSICGPKDLGITREQIALLKKHKIKSVMIKVGIPFLPAFLIGFLMTVIWGNVFFALLQALV